MRRTLVVANRTAATPDLVAEIQRRAGETRTAFTLLLPEIPRGKRADWTLEQALTVLRQAAAGPSGRQTPVVEGRVTGLDPLASIEAALAEQTYDEVLISTLPAGRSRWLRADLPGRVRRLGVPVTVVTPPEEPRVGLKDIAFFGGPG